MTKTMLSKSTQKNWFLILLFSCLSLSGLYSQGWWLEWIVGSGDSNYPNNEVVHIQKYMDGQSLALSPTTQDGITSMNITQLIEEKFGSISNLVIPNDIDNHVTHNPIAVVGLDQDTFVVLTNRTGLEDGIQDLFLYRFGLNTDNPFAELQWDRPVLENTDFDISGTSLIRTQDGNLITLGSIRSESSPNGLVEDLILVKTDFDANIIWSKTYNVPGNDLAAQILPDQNEGFWILKNVQPTLNNPELELWVIKVDSTGEIQWEDQIGMLNDQAQDAVYTQSGHLVITGQNNEGDLFVLNIDGTGNSVWRKDYPIPNHNTIGNGIIEDEQHNIIVSGKMTSDIGGQGESFIAKLTESGTTLWEKPYPKADYTESTFNDIELTPTGGYIMGGSRETSSSRVGLLVKTDTFGVIKGGLIHGNVFHDTSLDCLPNDDEMGLSNWIVKAENDSTFFLGTTDTQGNYSLAVDVRSGQTGNYILTVNKPNDYWQECVDSIPILLDYLDTAEVNVPMQAILDCPFLETDMRAVSILSPCNIGSFVVNYCNTGTDIANGAYIEITLDSLLSYENSSILPSLVEGQTYTFPLGDIPINTCGSFIITATISCEVDSNETICIEGHIFPDEICPVAGLDWSGALLQVDYICNGDSVQYEIKNIGTGSTEDDLDYIIIEDAVLLYQEPINLSPDQSIFTDFLPLDGSTYHLFAQQESGAPGPDWISLTAANCPNYDNDNTLGFPQSPGGPFSFIYCPPVFGWNESNELVTKPEGFGDENAILPNTDLTYTISFQNMGEETVSRVVIRDTLPAELDPTRLTMGVSSHPYTWRLDENGILTIFFYNINLPSSNNDSEASHGSISFSIAQQANLTEETIIENKVSIYYDFNPPITTPTTYHTVKEFLEIINSTTSVAETEMKLKIIPNPMSSNGAWIHLESEKTFTNSTLSLFNVNGERVRSLSGENNQFWVARGHLTPGFYFFSIENKGQIQASGKLIIK